MRFSLPLILFSLDSWVSFCSFGVLGVYCLVSILSFAAMAFMMVLGFIGHYIVLGYLQEFIDFSFVIHVDTLSRFIWT